MFDVGWQDTGIKFVGIQARLAGGRLIIITDVAPFGVVSQYSVLPGELPTFEQFLAAHAPKFPYGYFVEPD